MRILTQVRQYLKRGGQDEKIKELVTLAMDHNCFRVVQSPGFHTLSYSLMAGEEIALGAYSLDEDKLDEYDNYSIKLCNPTPEDAHSWTLAWIEIEGVDWAHLIGIDHHICRVIQRVTLKDGRPAVNWGGRTVEETRKLCLEAAGILYGTVRAMNVVPDELLQITKQPLTIKRGMGTPLDRRGPLPELVTIDLRGAQTAADGSISATDHRGQRFHHVRGHWWTPHTKTDKQWRRSHWRGDPTLGVVKHLYKA